MESRVEERKPPVAMDEPSIQEDSYEFNLIDLVWAAIRHRKMVVNWTLGAALAALIVVFLIPNSYRSTTKILPPQQSQSVGAMLMEQIGSLTGFSGNAPFKTPSDLYVAMIQSDEVAEHLVKKFDLQKVYGKSKLSRARKKLQNLTDINAGKEGIITISVEDHDPKRAADMAAAYVEELSTLNSRLAVTEAARRRLFFETQLSKAKDDLVRSELAMRDTQKSTGLLEPESQARATIESIVALRSRLVAAQVRLDALSTFATPEFPERVRLQSEVSTLQSQIKALEGNGTKDKSSLLPAGEVPEAGLEYVRRLRDLKAQEAIFTVLLKQYEMARMDEARDSVLVQVVQPAEIPDEKSAPPRTLIVVLFAGAAFIIACFAAYFAEQRHRIWSLSEVENARAGEIRQMLKDL